MYRVVPYPLRSELEGNENSEAGEGKGGPKGSNFRGGGGLLTEVFFSRASE